MNKIIAILIFGFQIALTFIVSFCIYMVLALLDCEFGVDGLFGILIFQPIMAVVLSSLSMFMCFLVGLPIRLNRKINHWWTTHFYVSFIGVAMGVALLILSMLPSFRNTVVLNMLAQETVKQIPNITLAVWGWIVMVFCCLHVYPPRQLIDKFR